MKNSVTLAFFIFLMLGAIYFYLPVYSEDLQRLDIPFHAGQTAFNKHEYIQAEHYFRHVSEKAKNDGDIKLYALSLGYLGYSQACLGKLSEAENTLKLAELVVVNTKSPEEKTLLLMGYIALSAKQNDIPKQLKYLSEIMTQSEESFLAINENKENYRQVFKDIQKAQQNLLKSTVPADADNYLPDALLKRKVLRWQDNKIIRISVGSNRYMGRNGEYLINFKRACSVWQNILNNRVQFEFVSGLNPDVDVFVQWSADRGGAVTGFNISGDKMRSANIVFHLIDFTGQFYSGTTVYKMSLHEIGHLLGVMGHSKNPDDIMFPTPSHAIEPSTRDISTMLKLYALPAKITNPSDKSLSAFNRELNDKERYSIKF